MNSKIVIRPFIAGDAIAVAEIYNESIKFGDATMDEVLHGKEEILQLVAQFHDREDLSIVEKSGRVIGFSIVKRYSDRSGYRFTCETAMYLKRDEVGKGYGAILKESQLQKCRELKYHHVVAKILANNERSIKICEKYGAEVVGVQKEVGFKDGKWIDVVIMQHILK